MARIKMPVCDKCRATCGNYQYAPGLWRCSQCIWDERSVLLLACVSTGTKMATATNALAAIVQTITKETPDATESDDTNGNNETA